MSEGGGCAGAILAFTVAGLLVWFVEKTWPYLLATLILAVLLAGVAAARQPRAVAAQPQIHTAKAAERGRQGTRMTDSERAEVEYALRDAHADGRIDSDELDERLQAAVRAKCWADVRPLLADLGLF